MIGTTQEGRVGPRKKAQWEEGRETYGPVHSMVYDRVSSTADLRCASSIKPVFGQLSTHLLCSALNPEQVHTTSNQKPGLPVVSARHDTAQWVQTLSPAYSLLAGESALCLGTLCVTY